MDNEWSNAFVVKRFSRNVSFATNLCKNMRGNRSNMPIRSYEIPSRTYAPTAGVAIESFKSLGDGFLDFSSFASNHSASFSALHFLPPLAPPASPEAFTYGAPSAPEVSAHTSVRHT